MKKSKDVNTYIAGAPKDVQAKLKELREAIKNACPDADERISYGMPYYSYHGRLAYFAYFKDHLSLFAIPPIPDEFKDRLRGNITGISTIQFSFDERLLIPLIKKLVKARMKKNEVSKKKK